MSYHEPTTEDIRRTYLCMFIDSAQSERGEIFDRWLAEHDRLVAERAWEEGRDAIIRYSLKHVENEPEEIAGYIDQHIVGIGGSKLDNPYRKEQENNDA